MKLVNVHKHWLFLLFLLMEIQSASSQVWTMQQCIDTAQVNNKNLEIGRNNISISELKEKEAKANLLPKVSANAEYRYYVNLPYQLMPLSVFGGPEGEYKAIQFSVPNVINANFQLYMPLFNPQAYGAINITKIASELTNLKYQKSQEQIYFEISNLYYNAQILQHQLVFIDSNIVNAERLLKNIQLLNEQLLANGSDVGKVKLQLSQLSTQKKSISNKYVQVLNALKFAMGVSLDQNLEIDGNIQYQNANEYSSSTSLDIRIIKTQNRLLSSELITLKKSRVLPSLNLIGNYGTTGFGYVGQPTGFLKFYPIGFAGIQLSYSLFNGAVNKRTINQKELELQNNELEIQLISEQNSMQLQNAHLERLVAKKSIETTTEEIELSRTIYQQTVLRQKLGVANLTDVLLADNTFREAQHHYLNSLIDYMKADLELKRLTGNITTFK